MKLSKALVAAGLLAMTQTSWALSEFDPSLIPSQGDFKAAVEDFSSALSYKAVSPAEPLGLIGFDVGLEVTATKLANVADWGAAIGSTDLNYLPLPKLHIHKGLPLGIDVGAVYSMVPGAGISYWGGELRYSFVSGNLALPAISLRGTYTQLMGVDLMDLSTKGLELSVSKGFLMFTPYAGIGNVWSTGTPKSTLDTAFDEESVSQFKMFGGVNINVMVMNIALEADKTGDATSYSAKLGFRF